MLWEVDIYPAEGLPNRLAAQVAGDAADLGLAADLAVTAAYGYLIQGDLSGDDVRRIAQGLLADRVVERTVAAPVGDAVLAQAPAGLAAGANDAPALLARAATPAGDKGGLAARLTTPAARA